MTDASSTTSYPFPATMWKGTFVGEGFKPFPSPILKIVVNEKDQEMILVLFEHSLDSPPTLTR